MECMECEKADTEKRDAAKAKVDEINLKLSQLNENKKEKTKDAQKTQKYVTLQFACTLTESFDRLLCEDNSIFKKQDDNCNMAKEEAMQIQLLLRHRPFCSLKIIQLFVHHFIVKSSNSHAWHGT